MIDYIDLNSFSGLHTAWMDDEQLNNLPIVDISPNDLTTRAENDCVDRSITETDSVLSIGQVDHDTQLLDEELEFSFDPELSPVLEPFVDPATVAISPLTIEQRHLKKSPKERRIVSSSLMRTQRVTTSCQASKVENNQIDGETALPAVTKRPRTRSSSWQDHEQRTFFSVFKNKWPPTPKGESEPPFSTLLLERFDVISTKIRSKSIMEVKQFHTTVMQNISKILELVDNDIDLTNPDQVRIAVWCWSKLLADKKYHDE
ncbi:hypothetical protein PsorP6_003833 [Peronosclerospora sorghi]|uniref:Uncharacterized protein n=1 Tax=Peronosclerospora sorghi TaxID=230839 RepID=A0ACC0VLX7_9STRA|nr:hypothetical protein PsorP6_003833 [Peronosclerospora sorghi]